MSIGDFLKEFWWLLFWLIPLLILYIYQRNKESTLGLSLTDQSLIIEFGLILLVVYLIQRYVFGEHIFFIIAIPILFLIYFALIGYLLRGNNYYIFEKTLLNEIHYNLEETEKIISPRTSGRLLIMSKDVYETKKHIGELDFPFWSAGDRIKFCDYYDENKGVFYHPRLPQMHNVTIHMATAFLLKMKEDIPKLYYDNIMLTWLSPYKTLYQLDVMKKNFPLHLMSIENQYDYKPFVLVKDTKDIYDEQFTEAMKVAKEHENIEKTLKDTEQDIINLLKEKGGSK
jgi:hypothetical protein